MTTETEVANRALQRCGASRVATGLLWTEDSRSAAEVRACFEILRKAELRRNVWRFSIKTQILRPYDEDDTKKLTFGTYVSTTVYELLDIVLASDGLLWQCVTSSVTGTNPTSRDFTKWVNYVGSIYSTAYSATISYQIGEIVESSSIFYISMVNQNEANTPASTPTKWKTFSTQPTGALFYFVYPIGAGPMVDRASRNVYFLPYGFMREANQAPKQGSYMPSGAPANPAYTDFQLEGQFFTTMTTGPIAYRFAADIVNSDEWDPMFVEGMSCRIAYDVAPILTQSEAKLQTIGGAYNQFMTEARLVNGIEKGPEEIPEDTYITCRY